jgi:hypothetical protein
MIQDRERALMHCVLQRLSNERLLEEVRRTEARIIAGTAIGEDYDHYVACQLILSERTFATTLNDPRD